MLLAVLSPSPTSPRSSVGYNQYVGRVKNVKRGHHILCKSTAAIPYLNHPVKTKSWRRFVPWFWWYEEKVHKPIHSFPAPEAVCGSMVTFSDGRTFDTDVIAFATGYRQTFPFLHADDAEEEAAAATADDAAEKEVATRKDAAKAAAAKAAAAKAAAAKAAAAKQRRGRSPSRRSADSHSPPPCEAPGGPACPAVARGWVPCTGARGAEDPLPSEHFIISPDAPRLAFICFVRPNVGAIPPMAEMQTFWWIQRLRGKVQRGAHAPSYGLLGKKLNYGVDYGNYMHQLAAEIDASPTISTLMRSPRALIAYALGQAYISFFRLQGPFASARAWETCTGELFAPVVQRGVAANAIFILTMAAFASMNMVAHAIELMLGLLAPAWLAKQRAAPEAAE